MPPPSRDICDAPSGEPGKQIVELRQFDLQLTFPGPRSPGKDVEDQLSAVNDPAGERRSEVAELSGRQVAVEDDDVGFEGL